MSNDSLKIRKLLEDLPLYKQESVQKRYAHGDNSFELREIDGYCEECESFKPLHNTHELLFQIKHDIPSQYSFCTFRCVSCRNFEKFFLIRVDHLDNFTFIVTKIAEDPPKELPRSKALSKFFSNDKNEYNKAVVCLANGYGVAAFAYMRRVVENNITGLLDLIQEGVDKDTPIAKSILELKITSPMSDKIKIANNALPDYLKPDGFNPLGQIYGLLSEGVHSLSDDACLNKAENLQACLEFLIGELATHKKNKEDFKKRLSALKG